MNMRHNLMIGCVVAVLAAVASVSWSGAALADVPVCQPATPPPTDAFPGVVTAADNFESGSLSPAYTVVTTGTGTASVSSAAAYSGTCSAYLHVTADSNSLADFSVPLAPGATAAYADAWFDITVAGETGNDVPYFRFFLGSTRYIDIYRYNNNGQLWLRVLTPTGNSYTRLRWQNIPLSTWHHLAMYVLPNGAGSTVQVWYDGTLAYSNTQVNTAATAVNRVQLGAEHNRQMGDTYIDDLIVKSVLP
ncbi:LamG-like jellyroll fold domain-containing protein [Rathayibacter soli]|uniref:LamG-like jellyroll fold domain-containing protein n=1 Tax=Rathayibacter soli TaxID=3144168 RepID=UPI0027E57D56|nr:LamG-like jellyroll fold domain-containing protein [Glaciibacter superstes]